MNAVPLWIVSYQQGRSSFRITRIIKYNLTFVAKCPLYVCFLCFSFLFFFREPSLSLESKLLTGRELWDTGECLAVVCEERLMPCQLKFDGVAVGGIEKEKPKGLRRAGKKFAPLRRSCSAEQSRAMPIFVRRACRVRRIAQSPSIS